MTNPRNISIQDYTYSLPEEKIAKYPLAKRDDSKLLVYNNGEITEDIYKNIANQLPDNSLLIFNNTKVVEARLLFQKPTGGVIEIFCLEPHEQYADITTAMLQKEKYYGNALLAVHPNGKVDRYWKKEYSMKEKKSFFQQTTLKRESVHLLLNSHGHHHL